MFLAVFKSMVKSLCVKSAYGDSVKSMKVLKLLAIRLLM